MASLQAWLVPMFLISNTHGTNLRDICSWIDPQYGAQYNFAALKLLPGGQMDYYKVKDSVDTDNRGYEYYFNICGQVLSKPSKNDSCLYSDGTSTFWEYCENINTSVTPNTCSKDSIGLELKQQINSLAFAYQYKPSTDECWPLSSNKQDTAYNISLYDESDPAQGIKIIYKFSHNPSSYTHTHSTTHNTKKWRMGRSKLWQKQSTDSEPKM